MHTQTHTDDSLSGLLDLTGQVALVTGAGQGVGEAVARMLAAQGATVAVNDYRAERADGVAADIEAASGRALGVQADVSDPESVQAMADLVTRELGPVDILVNNAGNAGADQSALAPVPKFWESDPADWAPWIDVNFTGVLLATRSVVGGMVERGHGRVITVISDAGRVGEADLVVYSGAKAGAAGFMRGLAKSVAPHGVTANCVALGAVRTPTIEPMLQNEAILKKVLRAYPLGRLGEPADPAALITFLASPAASWITGQTYPVNGGYSVSA
ncbi:SDR family oxidoreductase [Paraconexibacter antarcticus]|uniref:SDR family oxidoreductase n=1 Tax=Paraconexibacter antarcticus TaxID=2949664 RepID=A0ABY5DXF0_9ACTN|nr:SDR family oxidoreductase [Paraconexibacter antarcticus]UTI66695.1 SDR family oxidoreductase [Paraconexibacter antarcticus]